MSRSRRILFVSHDASRSGATLFLLNMLRWMRQHTRLDFDVAVRWDGDLLREFEQVCRCFLLHPMVDSRSGRCAQIQDWWDRRVRHRNRYHSLQDLIRDPAYDLLYLNTITLGDHLPRLPQPSLSVITHVHELPWAIRRYAHGEERRVLDSSDQVICVSDAVRSSLMSAFGDAAGKMRRIHGFVPAGAVLAGSAAERRLRLLTSLNVPADAFVVGICSHGSILKGVDLAAPLVRLLPQHVGGRSLHLVWVGALAPEYPSEVAVSDARQAGVAGRLHFVGSTSTPAEWLSIFDLHLMLSREDSFPLAVMEAAVQGVPTVAFRESGGAEEFIRGDAGACTPFLDLQALARTLVELLHDEPRRHAMGAVARGRVLAQHLPDIVMPQIVGVIEELRARSCSLPLTGDGK